MSEYLVLLILIPLIASSLELLLWKLRVSKVYQGIISITASLLSLSLYILFSYEHYYSQELVSSRSLISWIPSIGIDLSMGIEPITAIIGPILSVVVLYCLLISKFEEEKESPYFIKIMLVMFSVSGFIISRNVAVKLLFWESCWIPIFLNLITKDNKSIAFRFSIYWFVAELALMSGLVFMFINMGNTYETEKVSVFRNSTVTTDTTFWLFMSGILIRAMVLPFNKLINSTTKELSVGFSSIINVILPVLPLIFMMQVMLPIFKFSLDVYGPYISISLIMISFIHLFYFIKDKSLYNVINVQLPIYNAVILSCLCVINQGLTTSGIEMMAVRIPLSLLVVSAGMISAEHGLAIKSNYSWSFILAILLSFGIPGFALFQPLFKIIWFWNSHLLWVGVSVFAVFSILLIFTSYIMAKTTEQSSRTRHRMSYIAFITGIVLIIMAVLIPTRYSPAKSLLSNYYKGISGDMY